MSDALLEFSNVVKRYGDTTVVDRISFTVARGEFFTLLGPSGCGKTTTLRLLAGLETPDAGEITLGGRCLAAPSRGVLVPTDKRDMGMVFQSYAIWPHLTVFENVAFPLRVRRVAKAAIRQRVSEALALVGLAGLEQRGATELSGGQQQRVALARAIVYTPALLLLDEPLSNLDVKLREQMRAELHALHRRLDLAVVYVTHDQSEALAMSDRIAVVNQGRLEQVGTPAEVYERPRTRFVGDFLGRTIILKGILRSDAGRRWVDVAGKGQVIVACDGDVPRWRSGADPLPAGRRRAAAHGRDRSQPGHRPGRAHGLYGRPSRIHDCGRGALADRAGLQEGSLRGRHRRPPRLRPRPHHDIGAMTELAAPPLMTRWPRLRGFRVVELLLLLFFIAVMGLPVLFLLGGSFNVAAPGQAPVYGLQNWVEAFGDPQTLRALWMSFAFSVVRLIPSLVLSVTFAWLIARTDMPGAATVEFLCWLAFFVPDFPLTLAWMLLLDPNYGFLNNMAGALPFVHGPLFDPYSFWGIVWVHLGTGAIWLNVMLLTPVFRRLGATLEEAARVAGANTFTALLRITFPVLSPMIIAIAVLSFIKGLKSFNTELLLGLPAGIYVYGTRIYDYLRQEPPAYGDATALGSVFLLVLAGLAVFYRRYFQSNRRFTVVTGQGYSTLRIKLGRWRYVALGGFVLWFAVMMVLPLTFLVIGSFMRRYGFFGIKSPFTTAHWADLLGIRCSSDRCRTASRSPPSRRCSACCSTRWSAICWPRGGSPRPPSWSSSAGCRGSFPASSPASACCGSSWRRRCARCSMARSGASRWR